MRQLEDGPVGSFQWEGVQLVYERGEHNDAAHNERAVEVPIARHWIAQRRSTRGFEVGDVLSHYCDPTWATFDRYEGPLPVDVFDLDLRDADWIVSVSTLEHVRWDADPASERDPLGTPRAIAHLRTLLAPDGLLLVTMPLSVRPDLDRMVAAGELDEWRSWVLNRDSLDGPWVTHRCPYDPAWLRPYGPKGANAVWIAEFDRL